MEQHIQVSLILPEMIFNECQQKYIQNNGWIRQVPWCGERERERERERETDTDRQTDRQTDKKRERTFDSNILFDHFHFTD